MKETFPWKLEESGKILRLLKFILLQERLTKRGILTPERDWGSVSVVTSGSQRKAPES